VLFIAYFCFYMFLGLSQMTKGYFQNKSKIINDPVYGFISIPDDLVFDIMEHSYFQRLRRIKQLGLTYYVYPAAVHTRFQHALGSVHLMTTALEIIQRKGYVLDREDWLGAILAILLHDVGHGPFSHALEGVFVDGIDHEKLSLLFMEELNLEFKGALDTAILIFNGKHPKKFLHQLVSSQLDMDRLDYLRRDSFFTGVTEGSIGSERIIKMLRVVENELVVDRKGIYSIEKFLIARRLMYWQVYLHKTVIAAEQMLIKTLERARYLGEAGEQVYAPPVLSEFLLKGAINPLKMGSSKDFLDAFAKLDDNDIFSALKSWADHDDQVLAALADGMLNRKLPAIRIQNEPFDQEMVGELQKVVSKKEGISIEDSQYLVFTNTISNSAYNQYNEQLILWENPGRLVELSKASDMINYSMLSKAKSKYFICFPKWATDEFEQQ